jgi:Delta14-sterol reductase
VQVQEVSLSVFKATISLLNSYLLVLKGTSLNPLTHHFEFMGPYLTPLVIIALIMVPILLTSLCDSSNSCKVTLQSDILKHLSTLHLPKQTTDWLNFEAYAILISWMTFHVLCYLFAPGRLVKGTLLRNNETLLYPINAFNTFLITILLTGSILVQFGTSPFVWIATNTKSLLTSSIVLSVIQSIYLYISSRRPNALRALGGNSGYVFYDFFIGSELNPRIFSIDLKYLCELRPGIS